MIIKFLFSHYRLPDNYSQFPFSGNDLKWEIKRSLEAEAIEGPFSTQQMNKWIHENHFKEQVWVRKYGSNHEFYSSKRVDFELYL